MNDMWGDAKEECLQLCRDEFGKNKLAKKQQREKVAVVTVPPKTPVRQKWKLQTQVATDDASTNGQVPVKVKGLTKVVTLGSRGRVTSLWVRGILKQKHFHGEAPCPYEIEWDTKPEPISRRMTEQEVEQLNSNNYIRQYITVFTINKTLIKFYQYLQLYYSYFFINQKTAAVTQRLLF
jgi:hypothetical protein